MDNVSCKPKTKLSLVALVSIVCGIFLAFQAVDGFLQNFVSALYYSGFPSLEYIFDDFDNLFKVIYNMYVNGFDTRMFYAVSGCLVALIEAVTFTAFCISVYNKKKSKYLAVYPFILFLTMGVRLLNACAGVLGTLIYYLFGRRLIDDFSTIYEFIFESGFCSIASIVIVMLGYALMAIVLLKSKRADNDNSASSGLWKIAALVIGCGYLLDAAVAFVGGIIKFIMNISGYSYHFGDWIYLVSKLFSSSTLKTLGYINNVISDIMLAPLALIVCAVLIVASLIVAAGGIKKLGKAE